MLDRAVGHGALNRRQEGGGQGAPCGRRPERQRAACIASIADLALPDGTIAVSPCPREMAEPLLAATQSVRAPIGDVGALVFDLWVDVGAVGEVAEA